MKKLILLFCILGLHACSDKKVEIYKGYTKGLKDQQTVSIPAKAGQHLIATLIAPDTANLRINQIISPSGASDGPFGKELNYDLNETGEWELIIGGSLMQGDNYIGDFSVNWEITKVD